MTALQPIIGSRILTLREQRVMLNADLAELYGVQTKVAQALRVSADALVFDVTERGPDEELAFQFEAVSRLPKKERDAIRTLLEAMIVKSQVAGVLEGVAKASMADKPASKAASKRASTAHQR